MSCVLLRRAFSAKVPTIEFCIFLIVEFNAIMIGRWLLRLLPFVGLLLCWQTYSLFSQSVLFPGVGETVRATLNLLTSATLWQALWISHQAMLIGFGSALLVGVPLGIAVGTSTAFDAMVSPYIQLLLVLPKSALVPVLILGLGVGVAARAWVVFLYVFVYLVVNVRVGVRQIDPGLVLMARSFGASRHVIWRRVLLPGALPALLAALRVGIGRALAGMITVELLLSAVGIGRLILDFRGRFDAGSTYAVVVIVVAEAFLISAAMRQAERVFAPWAV